MQKNHLHKQIMRRVYYAYAIKMIGHPATSHAAVMMLSMILLTHFVSLGNVLYNFSHMRVVDTGQFVFNAFANTEAWTLLLIGVFVMAMLSLRWQLSHFTRIPKFARVS